MKTKVYLSGAISKYLKDGLREVMEANFDEQMEDVIDYFEKKGIEHQDLEIFNPAQLSKTFLNRDETFYLSVCMKELMLSDVVFFQINWTESYGCGSEYFLATKHKKEVKMMGGLC